MDAAIEQRKYRQASSKGAIQEGAAGGNKKSKETRRLLGCGFWDGGCGRGAGAHDGLGPAAPEGDGSADRFNYRSTSLSPLQFQVAVDSGQKSSTLAFKVQHCVTTVVEIALPSDGDDDQVAKALYKALMLLFREVRAHPGVLSTARYREQIRSLLDAHYVDYHHQAGGGGAEDDGPIKTE